MEKLISMGTSEENIIFLNFENPDIEHLKNYKELYNYINSGLKKDKMNYVFLDEIQNVSEYEKAIDGLFIKENVDIYITGSNAYFLSSDLATLLSGRYIEIEMMPLSFKEFISAEKSNYDLQMKFREYLENGSFPYILELNNNKDVINTYLDGIYHTVILKDIVQRKKISDVSSLESVIKFLFDNIGNNVSAKKISNAMTSSGRKISNHTVENYIKALTESFILYKSERYDIKGKKYLKTNEKYYLVDIGLRYYLLGRKYADMGHILENIVYLELIRRGYKVYTGRLRNNEVDFAATKNGYTEYYQVSQTVTSSDTLAREITSLKMIKDSNPKYLLTMDNIPETSFDGIRQIYLLDWLLE